MDIFPFVMLGISVATFGSISVREKLIRRHCDRRRQELREKCKTVFYSCETREQLQVAEDFALRAARYDLRDYNHKGLDWPFSFSAFEIGQDWKNFIEQHIEQWQAERA